jgi:type VI secretion system protein ImpL
MQDALAHVGKYFSGEKWVLGNQDSAPVDTAAVVKDLRAQYTADYVRNWRSFLQSASVSRYGDLHDAARKLSILGGNQSPLLSLFSIVSQNTHVAPALDTIFQATQMLTPPAITDKLVGPTNDPYMKALIGLQAAVEQTANAKGPAADQAAQAAAQQAGAAKAAAAQIAATFTPDVAGQVHRTVQSIMEAPINYVASMVANFGADQLNKGGAGFCAQVRKLGGSLFFTADGSSQVTIADLTTALKPGTGTFANFYAEGLQQALQKQGNAYVQTGTVKLSPSFVAFFNRAMQLSDALFAEDQGSPRVTFDVEPQLPEGASAATLVLDGVTIRSGQNLARRKITWPGGAGGDSRVSATVRGTELTGPSFTGSWTSVQLFQAADWRPENDGWRLEWRTGGHNADGSPLRIAVHLSAGNPANVAAIFRRPPTSGSCTGSIAQ